MATGAKRSGAGARARARRAVAGPRMRVRRRSGACSSRARMRIARCTPRRRRSMRATGRWRWRCPTGRSSAARTLDYVISKLSSRPPKKLDPRCPRGAAAGRLPAAVPRRGRRPRGGQRERRARQALRPAVALDSSTRSCAAPPVTGAPCSPSSTTRSRRAAMLHSVPDWLATKWWDELGAEDARALLRRVNRAGRVGTAGQRARDQPGRRPDAGLLSKPRPRPSFPRASSLERTVRRPWLRAVRARGDHAPVARLDARLADPRARSRAARARPVRRARRQDDASGGADRATEARSSPSSDTPAAPRRSSKTCRQMHASSRPRRGRRRRRAPRRAHV